MTNTFSDMIESFSPCFTGPGFDNFSFMTSGWIGCQGRHSISGVIKAGSSIHPELIKHHSTFYRFLSEGKWLTDDVGAEVFKLMLPYLPKNITLILDDTLCEKTGPHLFGTAMHYNSHASTYGRGTDAGPHKVFSYGHNWVVASIWLPLPWGKQRGLAIPVMVRLYRGKKRCPERKYLKRTEIAREIVQYISGWIPEGYQLNVVGDSEYSCENVVRHLPEGVTFTGAMTMDAALYAIPSQEKGGRGRPAVKGERLLSPEKLAESKSVVWEERTIKLYGRKVSIKYKEMICLWYTVAGTIPVKMVVIRDPNRRMDDRAFFSTNTKLTVQELLAEFGKRWEIEVAFRNSKQGLGIEDPQNGWWSCEDGARPKKKKPGPNAKESVGESAVTHTIMMAFAAYALTILWYLKHGDPEADVARVKAEAPWYRHKQHPSFADMLAALRRELWRNRFSRDPDTKAGAEKFVDALPHHLLVA